MEFGFIARAKPSMRNKDIYPIWPFSYQIQIHGSLGSCFTVEPKWKATFPQRDEHDLIDKLWMPDSGLIHATHVGNKPMPVQVTHARQGHI